VLVPIIGVQGQSNSAGLTAAIQRAGCEAIFFDGFLGFRAWHQAQQSASPCVLFDADMAEARQLTAFLRSQRSLESSLMIGLASMPTYTAFSAGIRVGADDVVLATDGAAVTRRVSQILATPPQSRPPIRRGCAVVAHECGFQRTITGRVLRQGGFAVHFAQDYDELVAVCEKVHPGLLVTSRDVLGGVQESVRIEALRRACRQPDLPVVVSRRADTQTDNVLSGVYRVAETFEERPTDHLLFQINELLVPGVKDIRESPRILRTTLCSFRIEGEMALRLGMTYNVSERGLFVRTLETLPMDSVVWLEFRPHESGRAVHLRGRVAWVSSPQDAASRLSPPGFGIALLEAQCPPDDLQRYVRAYRVLAESKKEGLQMLADIGEITGTEVRLQSVAPLSLTRGLDVQAAISKRNPATL
jgi:Tfp pilus assembly protein PilZ